MSRGSSDNAKTRAQWDALGIDGDVMLKKWPEMVLEDEVMVDYVVDERDEMTIETKGGDYDIHPHDYVGPYQANPPVVKGPEVANQLYEFTVRDIYPRQGWFDKDGPAVLPARLLTVVGWVVEDDGTHIHVSAMYDQEQGMYGDGHVIPKVNIVAKRAL